ncbi:MAG: isoprenylcysteine carboxylmethyltransferase family protein [Spirochaetales bacterium]|nr:isoprenylcysteine carboxylmethyltransferase family protein [Spirochaetales bacterium]
MSEDTKRKIDASHIISTIAGVFIVAQFVLMFFFSIEGILILKICGYVLWGIIIILGWLPVYTFKKYGGVKKGRSYIKTTKLVTKGIYSIIRHPQFLAMPLMSIALMLISQHWIVLILGIPGVVLSYLSTLGADTYCIDKFGDEYKEYMKRVPGINILLGLWRRLFSKNQ